MVRIIACLFIAASISTLYASDNSKAIHFLKSLEGNTSDQVASAIKSNPESVFPDKDFHTLLGLLNTAYGAPTLINLLVQNQTTHYTITFKNTPFAFNFSATRQKNSANINNVLLGAGNLTILSPTFNNQESKSTFETLIKKSSMLKNLEIIYPT
jgi:hypothetical protein